MTNNGPDDASNLTLADTLPTGATLTNVVAGDWTCDGNAPLLTCTVGTLANGQSSIVAITLDVPSSSGDFNNAAYVSSATIDPHSANNNSSETTTVNAAPVVSGLNDTGYTAGDTAQSIASSATVTDSDSTNLASAVIRITGGYQTGVDLLSFTDTNTMTGSWDATSGTLTLTGSDSVAAYQSALRSITFYADGTPGVGVRDFSITVNDGSIDSIAVTGQVTVSVDAVTLSTPTPLPPADPIYLLAPISAQNPATADSSVTTDSETNTLSETTPDTASPTHGLAPTDTGQSSTDPIQNNDSATKPSAADYTTSSTRNTASANIAGKASGGFVTHRSQRPPSNETLRITTGPVTLGNNTNLWKQLDTMKQQMQGALDERQLHERIFIGAAKGATLFVFAGTVNWMLKSSSMIAGVLSSLPLWTQFDPLAVLTLTRQQRKKRKEERRADARKDDSDYGKLGKILERRLMPRNEIRE